jgi:hypothetical protein
MSFRMSAGVPLWEPGYQPRHSSSKRRRRGGSGRLVRGVRGGVRLAWARRPEPSYLSTAFGQGPLSAASGHCIDSCDQDPTLELPALCNDSPRYPSLYSLVRPYVVAAGVGC